MEKHLLHGTTLDLMADVSMAALTVGRASASAGGTGMERDEGHRLLPKSTIENMNSTEMPLPIFEGQRQGASNTIVSPDGSAPYCPRPPRPRTDRAPHCPSSTLPAARKHLAQSIHTQIVTHTSLTLRSQHGRRPFHS